VAAQSENAEPGWVHSVPARSQVALFDGPRDDNAGRIERGKFDTLFLADVLGVYDVYRGSPDAAIANAVQVPVNDPLLPIPAMAYVTHKSGLRCHDDDCVWMLASNTA
jgi:alkanesulfonate monooxygenase SsuD/methylene tetrahydromethanopterin reductase-like flavin-dependent oxidoreductase (luciferase family)